MAEEQITVDNVSKELLKSILEGAYMSLILDKDGDIVVKEQVNCFVLPDKQRRTIALVIAYGFKPGVNDAQKLMFANKLSKEFIMARAFVVDGTLRFQYDICLDGGISAKAFVMTVKRFCSIPPAALQGSDLIS